MTSTRERWPGRAIWGRADVGVPSRRPVIVKLMSTDTRSHCALPRRTVRVRRVDECSTLGDLFNDCLPAFGGAYLRRIYQILDRAIGMGCPLTLAVSGPVTVSGQHQTWLLSLLEFRWVCYLRTSLRCSQPDSRSPWWRRPTLGFVGPPADGSVFLNSMKLWAMKQTGLISDYAFDL